MTCTTTFVLVFFNGLIDFRVARVVAPKKEALKAAESELAVAMAVSEVRRKAAHRLKRLGQKRPKFFLL